MSVKDKIDEAKRFTAFKDDLLSERGCCQICGSSKNLLVYFADAAARNKLNAFGALLLCPRCYNNGSPGTEAAELLTFQKMLSKSMTLNDIR